MGIITFDSVEIRDDLEQELNNVAVGYDGSVYSNAGESVRTQASNLNYLIDQLANFPITFLSGFSNITTTSNEQAVAADGKSYECAYGDSFTITAMVTPTVRPEVYTSAGLRINEYDSSGTVLTRTNYEDISSPINYEVKKQTCAYITIFVRLVKPSGQSSGINEIVNYSYKIIKGDTSLKDSVIVPEIDAINDDIFVIKNSIDGINNGVHQYLTNIEIGGISTSTGENNSSPFIRTSDYITTQDVESVYYIGDRPYYVYLYFYDYVDSRYVFDRSTNNRSDTSKAIAIDKTKPYFRLVAYFADDGTNIPIDDFYNRIYMLANYESEQIDDLKERVSALESGVSVIPDYWKTHIGEKISEILEKDMAIGEHGDSFVFITDTHTLNNSKVSPALIKYILQNSSVNKVVNGGDTIRYFTTKPAAVECYREWNSLMYGVEEIRLLGNHDLNNFNGQNPDNVITTSEFYGLMVKPMEKFMDTGAKTYFVFDNESEKFRTIYLDTEHFDNAQKSWLESMLTEKDSSWTVLVMQHRLFGTTMGVLDTVGQAVINSINSVYSQINATFIGILAGHSHVDYNTTESVNGYALIVTNCDTLDGSYSGLTRERGTITEQSFDVVHIDFANRTLYFTRIGAGSNRSIAY